MAQLKTRRRRINALFLIKILYLAGMIPDLASAQAPPQPTETAPQTTTVTTPQGVTINVIVGAPAVAAAPVTPVEPPPPAEEPKRENGGFSHMSIGPGFVFVSPVGGSSETFGGLSIATFSGTRLFSIVEVGGGMSFMMYDFGRMGDAYEWLFTKDSYQIPFSPFLMFLIPLWYSQISLDAQISFYISQRAPSFYFGFGGGFSNVLIDGYPCPGFSFSGNVGYDFTDELGGQIRTIYTDSFSSEGGVSVSTAFSLVFKVLD